MYRRLDRAAWFVAVALAWAGGLALCAVVLMSVVSIAGRAGLALGLPWGPVPGDTEWVEFGTGFAVFAFLPWCTYARGHATVDLFQPVLGRAGNRVAEIASELLLLALAALIGWQTFLGMLDKRQTGETTWIAQVPLWWGYGAALLGAAGFVVVAAFCVLRAARPPAPPPPVPGPGHAG